MVIILFLNKHKYFLMDACTIGFCTTLLRIIMNTAASFHVPCWFSCGTYLLPHTHKLLPQLHKDIMSWKRMENEVQEHI